MKSSKKLMIVLLVLAIVTALSAGTLAIYTSNLDNAVGTTNITAKSFVFKPGESFSDAITFRMAPGEDSTKMENGSVAYELTNSKDGVTSEVPMNVTITPTFGTFFDIYKDVEVTVVLSDTLGTISQTLVWNAANLPSAVELNNAFTASNANTIKCTIAYKWLQDGTDAAAQTARDMAAMDDAKTNGPKTITLGFSAVQAI